MERRFFFQTALGGLALAAAGGNAANGKPYSETEVAFIRDIIAQELKAKGHTAGR